MDINKINPLDELVFKKLFCGEECKSSLMSLLNSILNLEGDKKINDILKIENKQMKEDRIIDKRWILSIETYTIDESKIDIEIQLTDKKDIVDTALICLSKLCVDLKEDEFIPKKSVLIIFLDYEYFTSEEFHTVYHFREDENYTLLSDKLEVHFIELPKFQRTSKELSNPFHRWMTFLDNLTSKELINSIKEEDDDIRKVLQRLEEIRNNSDFINIYNAREKIINEYHELIKDAEEKGLRRGLEIGKREGLENGAIKAYRDIIIDVLKEYGPIPKEVREFVKNNGDLNLLKKWYTIARFSGSSQEFMNEV